MGHDLQTVVNDLRDLIAGTPREVQAAAILHQALHRRIGLLPRSHLSEQPLRRIGNRIKAPRNKLVVPRFGLTVPRPRISTGNYALHTP